MPMTLSGSIQVGLPAGAFADAASAAETFAWEEEIGNSLVVREPVGVVGAITPWNYPLYQIALKVAPALAAGCTVVLKPSEVAPLNAFILAEVIDEVGLPPASSTWSPASARWWARPSPPTPRSTWSSFTGSTRAGQARHGAGGREHQAGRPRARGQVGQHPARRRRPRPRPCRPGVFGCYMNSGQTCSALTRMLVPRDQLAEVEELAAGPPEGFTPGDPFEAGNRLGPLVSAVQRERVAATSTRDRGGRQARHRRGRAPRGPRQGLLRAAHRLLRGDAGDDHRPGGDLRPGALDHPLRHRGRGDRDRQRHPLRAGRRRLVRRPRARRAGGSPAAHRPGRHQRRRASTRSRPSAATSSRASDASGASTA